MTRLPINLFSTRSIFTVHKLSGGSMLRIISLILFCSSAFVQALPEDSQQEIHIASDQASLDRQKGLIVYTGNVKMQQGTLSIEAEKITLTRTEQGLQKIVAIGSPARYEQILEKDEAKTFAYGNTIIYQAVRKELTLLKNAGLEKQGNLFSGEKIVYLINEQRVMADGQSSSTNAQAQDGAEEKSGRIKMIIQPQSDKAASDKEEQ